LLGETRYDAAGVKLSSQYYLWLDSLPIGGLALTYNANGAVASSTRFYLHADHLNTPRLATNQAGEEIWRWASDAFGEGDAISAPNSGLQAINLRFPGQYFDSESGLHYNYFRDYDPETGRYVESDPIGLAGGVNTFGYVEGNPLVKTDPLGLWVVQALQIGARAVAAGGRGGAFSGPKQGASNILPPRGLAWNPGQGLTLPPLAPPMPATGDDNMCEPGEEPCEEEVKHCEQICENSMSDPNRQNVWGGSWNTCMMGCVSQRCGGNRAN